jgi:hypothetical protein
MKKAIALLGVLACADCAPPPQANLNRDSYGPLVKYQDANTHDFLNPPSCNPSQFSDTPEMARQITGLIMSPFKKNGDKIDDTILKEDLQKNFLMPGDPSGQPTVVLLHRGSDGIVFWYDGDLVTLKEVGNAASQYCDRTWHKKVLYEGSSQKCSGPKMMPVAINGQATMKDTYDISSFQCVGGTIAPPISSFDRMIVRSIQVELLRLKILTGAADGAYGPKTKAAISDYQKQKGLPVDGNPSQSLLDSLKGS